MPQGARRLKTPSGTADSASDRPRRRGRLPPTSGGVAPGARSGGEATEPRRAPLDQPNPSLATRPDHFRFYVAAVIVAGLASLAATLLTTSGLPGQPGALLWALLVGLLVAELLPINVVVRGQEGELLTSTAFAFALLIAFGPGVAVPALCAGSLVGDLVRRKPWPRAVFNVSQYAIALTAAGAVQALLLGGPPESSSSLAGADLPLVLVAGLVFFVLNTVLVDTVLALSARRRVWEHIRSGFLAQVSTAGFALGLAPVMVVVGDLSVGMLILLGLPLVAIHRNTRQAAANEHQALHDPLTGLPNRVLFHDRVEQAMESARRNETGAVVMVIDLDRFKDINDTLGHHHGDRLLEMVGRRLSAVLRGEDSVARLGGDEFAVLLPSVSDRRYALAVAEKLLAALRPGFEVDGLALEVGASIGIACFPAHGHDKESLIQRADIAMYAAKAEQSGARMYETELDRRSARTLALAGELRRALEQDELVLHFQPKIHIASGRVVGAEALTRWAHPVHGLIPPDEFVPLAEYTGLITPLTRRVMSLALEQAARWEADGHPLSVAVNLGARSLLDQQLVGEVSELLGERRVDPSLLRLEITESMIVGDPERAGAVLAGLAGLGVRLAIDDFGTGYSSLAHLRRLPVDEIKIDKSFILEMRVGGSDETVVRSIIDLARNLKVRSVAEGVEDGAVLGRLEELGCDVAQGYHIAPPLTPEEFGRWMQARPGTEPRQAVA